MMKFPHVLSALCLAVCMESVVPAQIVTPQPVPAVKAPTAMANRFEITTWTIGYRWVPGRAVPAGGFRVGDPRVLDPADPKTYTTITVSWRASLFGAVTLEEWSYTLTEDEMMAFWPAAVMAARNQDLDAAITASLYVILKADGFFG